MAASNLRYVIYDSQDENFVYIEYWIDDDFGLTLSSIQPVPRDVYQAYEDGAGISVRHNQTDEYLIYQRPATQFYRYSSNFDPVGFGWYAYAPFPFIAVQEINFVLRALSAGMLPGPSTSDDLIQGVTNLYMTTSEKSKLSGIAAGAEVNVNANWNATSGDARILNKPEIFLNRYDAEANTARQEADATLIIERYVTVQADGHGEKTAAQSSTPSEGNKIVRKIWHKATAFEDSDVTTWTLAHTFADDTAYIDTIDTFQELLTAATYGSIPLTLAQTWEDVPALTGLLDGYTADLVGAFAPALLDSTYTGDCLRVRRASDNAEQDIGFDGQDLDTAALATFCAGTDGFVVTWYNQDGSGNDLDQGTSAAQPKIYDAATGVELENAVAALRYDGSDDYLQSPAISALDTDTQSSFVVATDDSGDTSLRVLWRSSYASGALSLSSELTGVFKSTALNFNARDSTGGYKGVSNAFSTNQSLISTVWNASDVVSGKLNGVDFTTNNTTGADAVPSGHNFTRVGVTSGPAPTSYWQGIIQAVILYSADKSADRAAIETRLNDYFNIYP